MSLEALLDVVQREDGVVQSEQRAAAEKAMFIKIGEMDDTVRSYSERAADDDVIRTLNALMHCLTHRGLKTLVTAHVSKVGTPGTRT